MEGDSLKEINKHLFKYRAAVRNTYLLLFFNVTNLNVISRSLSLSPASLIITPLEREPDYALVLFLQQTRQRPHKRVRFATALAPIVVQIERERIDAGQLFALHQLDLLLQRLLVLVPDPLVAPVRVRTLPDRVPNRAPVTFSLQLLADLEVPQIARTIRMLTLRTRAGRHRTKTVLLTVAQRVRTPEERYPQHGDQFV